MRPKRYAGLTGNNRKMRDKYAECERVRIAGGEARRLTEAEIGEWHERLHRILNPEYVVIEVKTRRAVV